MIWQVWQIPTEFGKKWFPEMKIVAQDFTNKDDAEMEAYLVDSDETAPDKHEFRHIIVREIH